MPSETRRSNVERKNNAAANRLKMLGNGSDHLVETGTDTTGGGQASTEAFKKRGEAPYESYSRPLNSPSTYSQDQ